MLRMLFLVGLLAGSTFISGCASLPMPDEMRAEVASYKLPKLPEQGKAIVYIVRPDWYLSWTVRFNVFVDDWKSTSEMGYTRGGEYIYFNLLPGEHDIYSKAENWAEIHVSAKAGDIIYIEQQATVGIIIARNILWRLEDDEGKYHVKALTLGTILKSDK